MSTAQAYLENPGFLNTLQDVKLDYADREEIAGALTRLFSRLFPTTDTECENEDDPDEPEVIG